MRRFATLAAALACGFSLVSPAPAAEAAPVAADSPAAATSPTTIGRGVTNDGTSATTSTTNPGTASAPSGAPGASDPSITLSTTTTLSPIPRNSGLVTAPGAGNDLGGAVTQHPLGPDTVTPPLDQ